MVSKLVTKLAGWIEILDDEPVSTSQSMKPIPKPVPKPSKCVKQMIYEYEDIIIPPQSQFRDGYTENWIIFINNYHLSSMQILKQ